MASVPGHSMAPAPARPADEAQRDGWLIATLPAIFGYSLLVPSGLSIEVGPLVILAFRAVLMAATPFLVLHAFSRGMRLIVPDWLMIGTVVWTFVGSFHHLGFSNGLESGGREFFDVGIAYLLGRTCIRDEADLKRFLVLLLPGLAAVGFALVLESITGRFRILSLTPEFYAAISAAGSSPNEYRLGLLRAFGPFRHAILGGLFMASFLPFYFLLFREWLVRWGGVATTLTAFFTLSSSAIASLAIQIFLLLYRFGFHLSGYRVNWRIAGWTMLGIIVFLEVFSQNGAASVIARYASLNAGTGGYRLLIFEFGSASVAKYPFLGIGFESYERPAWMLGDSVDNHWLAQAMRFGLPFLFLSLGQLLYVIGRLVTLAMTVGKPYNLVYTAGLISLFTLLVEGLTVAFLFESLAWLMFLIGAFTALIVRAETLAAQARMQVRS